MKLFKVNQFDNNNAKAIKSFICIAKDEDEALAIDPTRNILEQWAHSCKNVEANYLGRTTLFKCGYIVMRSFDE